MITTTASVESVSITKVRGFVVCKTTDDPLAGGPVTLWAEVDNDHEYPLGLLTSDGTGYVSFAMTGLSSKPFSFKLKSPRFDEEIKMSHSAVPRRSSFPWVP